MNYASEVYSNLFKNRSEYNQQSIKKKKADDDKKESRLVIEIRYVTIRNLWINAYTR